MVARHLWPPTPLGLGIGWPAVVLTGQPTSRALRRGGRWSGGEADELKRKKTWREIVSLAVERAPHCWSWSLGVESENHTGRAAAAARSLIGLGTLPNQRGLTPSPYQVYHSPFTATLKHEFADPTACRPPCISAWFWSASCPIATLFEQPLRPSAPRDGPALPLRCPSFRSHLPPLLATPQIAAMSWKLTKSAFAMIARLSDTI